MSGVRTAVQTKPGFYIIKRSYFEGVGNIFPEIIDLYETDGRRQTKIAGTVVTESNFLTYFEPLKKDTIFVVTDDSRPINGTLYPGEGRESERWCWEFRIGNAGKLTTGGGTGTCLPGVDFIWGGDVSWVYNIFIYDSNSGNTDVKVLTLEEYERNIPNMLERTRIRNRDRVWRYFKGHTSLSFIPVRVRGNRLEQKILLVPRTVIPRVIPIVDAHCHVMTSRSVSMTNQWAALNNFLRGCERSTFEGVLNSAPFVIAFLPVVRWILLCLNSVRGAIKFGPLGQRETAYIANLLSEELNTKVFKEFTIVESSIKKSLEKYLKDNTYFFLSIAMPMNLDSAHYWGNWGLPTYIPDKNDEDKFYYFDEYQKVYKEHRHDRPRGNSYVSNYDTSFLTYDCLLDQNIYKDYVSIKDKDVNIVQNRVNRYKVANAPQKERFKHYLKSINDRDYVPYKVQYLDHKKIACMYPLKIFPFHHYDPRAHYENESRKNELINSITREHSFFKINNSNNGKVELQEMDFTETDYNNIFNDHLKKHERVFQDIVQNNDGRGYFWGFKMYTRLGYSPDDFTRFPHLHDFYRRCGDKVPITVHCSPGGMGIADHYIYFKEATKETPRGSRIESAKWDRYDDVWYAPIRNLLFGVPNKTADFDGYNNSDNSVYNIAKTVGKGEKYIDLACTNPSGWRNVLSRYGGLKICFAHFGGEEQWNDYCTGDINCNSGYGKDFRSEIIHLINMYSNVYTDLSCYDGTPEKVIKQLAGVLKSSNPNSRKLKKRLLFGTDWYMTVLDDLTVNDFYKNMFNKLLEISNENNVNYDLFYQFAVINPLRFLGLIEGDDERVNTGLIERYKNYLIQTLNNQNKRRLIFNPDISGSQISLYENSAENEYAKFLQVNLEKSDSSNRLRRFEANITANCSWKYGNGSDLQYPVVRLGEAFLFEINLKMSSTVTVQDVTVKIIKDSLWSTEIRYGRIMPETLNLSSSIATIKTITASSMTITPEKITMNYTLPEDFESISLDWDTNHILFYEATLTFRDSSDGENSFKLIKNSDRYELNRPVFSNYYIGTNNNPGDPLSLTNIPNYGKWVKYEITVNNIKNLRKEDIDFNIYRKRPIISDAVLSDSDLEKTNDLSPTLPYKATCTFKIPSSLMDDDALWLYPELLINKINLRCKYDNHPVLINPPLFTFQIWEVGTNGSQFSNVSGSNKAVYGGYAKCSIKVENVSGLMPSNVKVKIFDHDTFSPNDEVLTISDAQVTPAGSSYTITCSFQIKPEWKDSDSNKIFPKIVLFDNNDYGKEFNDNKLDVVGPEFIFMNWEVGTDGSQFSREGGSNKAVYGGYAKCSIEVKNVSGLSSSNVKVKIYEHDTFSSNDEVLTISNAQVTPVGSSCTITCSFQIKPEWKDSDSNKIFPKIVLFDNNDYGKEFNDNKLDVVGPEFTYKKWEVGTDGSQFSDVSGSNKAVYGGYAKCSIEVKNVSGLTPSNVKVKIFDHDTFSPNDEVLAISDAQVTPASSSYTISCSFRIKPEWKDTDSNKIFPKIILFNSDQMEHEFNHNKLEISE